MPFYSQYGEDKALWDFFEKRRSGVCVEVGAFDGETLSNSLFFEENGWQAVLVEPIPHLAERIRQRRPAAMVFSCAAGAKNGEITLSIARDLEVLSTTKPDPRHLNRIAREGGRVEELVVPMRTLDDLLSESGVASADFITIDVEGGENEVLAGCDLERWKPRIVIVENNLRNRSLILHDEMLRRDYHLIKITGCNEWYAPAWEKRVVSLGKKVANRVRSTQLRARNFACAIAESTGLKSLDR